MSKSAGKIVLGMLAGAGIAYAGYRLYQKAVAAQNCEEEYTLHCGDAACCCEDTFAGDEKQENGAEEKVTSPEPEEESADDGQDDSAE